MNGDILLGIILG